MIWQQLKRIGSMMANLNSTCEAMRNQIKTAQQESTPMLEEASILTAEKMEVETKQRLLSAFDKHFIVSDEDLTLLTSSVEPINDRFFQIMNRVKQIRKDCEVLLGTENQSLGVELMEQTSRNLNAAFKKLYSWIQRGLKNLDLEDPQISRSIRRALRILAERPTLFQNCLDFFAEARDHTLSDAFHTALTDAATGGSTTARAANPIELQTHDLLRYVGDMLAWVHSTTVSEKEALEGLFISDGDEIAKEIQAGRDNEPWSRIEDKNGKNGDDTPVFNGHTALNDLVNRDLEGVARVLKQRIEIAVQSNEDPLLVYKALNLLKFYQDVYIKLVGTESNLGNNIVELQTSTLSHFEQLLRDETSAIANETPAEDLSTPPFLLHALDQLKSFLKTSPDISNPETSQLLSSTLVPFLDHCSEMTTSIPDTTAQDLFQLNYFVPVHSTLHPILPPNHGLLSAVQQKLTALHESLTSTQHSFLLTESGVGPLLDSIQAAQADHDSDTETMEDAVSLPAFSPAALSASAAQLDDFLPSALMDLLENMQRLADKATAKSIAHEAAKRFCKDFERVEEVLARADEGGGDEEEGKGEGEGEEGTGSDLLRDVYPRTTAEVRLLLS